MLCVHRICEFHILTAVLTSLFHVLVSDDQYVYCIACANRRIYVAKRRQESSALA